ncbi:hypothetical protein Slala05_51640 [Streptomyces lavendulae subsp. lavendulae]|nr:hypothetical protein Slala05_51640 [Streptomyces lavendulae subsp. lavendulae]
MRSAVLQEAGHHLRQSREGGPGRQFRVGRRRPVDPGVERMAHHTPSQEHGLGEASGRQPEEPGPQERVAGHGVAHALGAVLERQGEVPRGTGGEQAPVLRRAPQPPDELFEAGAWHP